MRILVVGTGGVGSAFAGIARRRSFFEHCALADYEPARPESLVAELDDSRFRAHRIDASSREDVGRLIRDTRADAAPPFLAMLAEYGSPHCILELAPQ